MAAVALLAASCGGSGGDDASGGDSKAASACPVAALSKAKGPVEIKVWYAFVGLAATTFQQLVDKYNASQTKVKVTAEAQGTYEEELKKYTDSLRDPASLPQVVLAEDTNTQFMIDSGSVVPAASCLEADPKSQAIFGDLLPAVKAGYSVKGTLWPGAFSVSTPVIYYNKAHFGGAGLDPNTPPATLDDIRKDAAAIKKARPDGSPMVFRADSWWMEHLETRAHQALVDQDNGRKGLATKSKLVNDKTNQYLDWMIGMKNDGLLKVVAYSQTFDAYLSMATQSSSMLIETSTAATTIDALITGSLKADQLGVQTGTDLSKLKFPDLDVGVGELPGPGSAGSGQIGGNAFYLVDNTAPEKVAAGWDFMKWFNQTDNQAVWTTQGSYLPVHTKVADSAQVQQYFTTTRPGSWLATAYKSLQVVDPKFPGPVIGPYKEFRTASRAMLEDILIAGGDRQKALDTANSTFQKALDEYKLDAGN